MNQTLTEKDAAWLDRIHQTLDQNEVRPSHSSDDFNRLGTLIATLRGEHVPASEDSPSSVAFPTITAKETAMNKPLTNLLDDLDTLFRGCKLANGHWPNETHPGEACPGVSVDVAFLRRLEEQVHALKMQPPVPMSEITQRTKQAKSLFDQISEATYMGMGFRMCLVENPQAMAAAQMLVTALKASGIKLSTPDYRPPDET